MKPSESLGLSGAPRRAPRGARGLKLLEAGGDITELNVAPRAGRVD